MAFDYSLPDEGGVIAPPDTTMRPGESVGGYDARLGYATPQADDYVATQRVERIKARNFFGQRGIPAVDNGTSVEPVVDEAGAALTQFDPTSGTAWDSWGSPRKPVQQADGSIALADPYADAPVKVDKQGNRYRAPKGLEWRPDGVDPDVVQANQEKATADAASALNQQATLDARDVRQGAKELKKRHEALSGIIPSLATAADPDSARQAIDDHFNEAYADPAANAKTGFFGTGDLTPEAQALRAQIDQQKAQAHQEFDAQEQTAAELAASRARAEVNGQRARALREQVIASKLAKAKAAGAVIPELPAAPVAAETQANTDEAAPIEPPIAPDSVVPAAPAEGDGDTMRGLKKSLKEIPALAKGTLGLIGATAEKIFGKGGISTAVKEYGLAGYADAMKQTGAAAHENDDVTKAWAKARSGDVGALVDWAQYAGGYLIGQAGETAAVALLGGLVGSAAGPEGTAGGAVAGVVAPQATKAGIRYVIEKVVASQAMKLAEEQAAKIGIKATAETAATPLIRKAAAASIGQKVAIAGNSLMMEAGSIFPEAVKQAQSEGRELSGTDLAKIWATSIAAGGVDAITDNLGLETALGKFRLGKGGRLATAAATGAALAATGGAGEVAQTALERLGAGQSLTDEEAKSDYINSGAIGVLGGAALGGGSALVHGGNPETQPPAPQPEPAAPVQPVAPTEAAPVAEQPLSTPSVEPVTAGASQSTTEPVTAPAEGLTEREQTQLSSLEAMEAKGVNDPDYELSPEETSTLRDLRAKQVASARSIPSSNPSSVTLPASVEAQTSPSPVAAQERTPADAAPVSGPPAGDAKISSNAEAPSEPTPTPKPSSPATEPSAVQSSTEAQPAAPSAPLSKPERIREDAPEAKLIRDEIDRITAEAERRHADMSDGDVKNLTHPSDLLTSEEKTQLHKLKLSLRPKSMAEAKSDIQTRRAERLAAKTEPDAPTPGQWGEFDAADHIGARIETKNGKSGTLTAVTKNVVKFRKDDGKSDVSHINNARVTTGKEAVAAVEPKKSNGKNAELDAGSKAILDQAVKHGMPIAAMPKVMALADRIATADNSKTGTGPEHVGEALQYFNTGGKWAKDAAAALESARAEHSGDRGENMRARIDKLSEASEPIAAAASTSLEAQHVTKLAQAVLRTHEAELKTLGHSVDIQTGETPNASGIMTNGEGKIIIDPEKLAKDTAKLTPSERLKKIKRAIAEEVFHVATLKYASENSENFSRVKALADDAEWAARGREAYGPEWDGLKPFQKGAEIARMIAQGRGGKLTEASYRYLADFMRWLRKKLRNLSPETREVVREIEDRMGKYRAESKAVKGEPMAAASSADDSSEPSYSKAPDSLLGFRRNGPQRGYAESNYKFEQPVKVTFSDGETTIDQVKGLNKSHAMERARRNWPGAAISEATPKELSDALESDKDLAAASSDRESLDIDSAREAADNFERDEPATWPKDLGDGVELPERASPETWQWALSKEDAAKLDDLDEESPEADALFNKAMDEYDRRGDAAAERVNDLRKQLEDTRLLYAAATEEPTNPGFIDRMKAKLAARKLTSEERDQIGPILRWGPADIYQGTADKLKSEPGTKTLGVASEKAVDREREIYGHAQTPFRALRKKLGGKEFDAAAKEVATFREQSDRKTADGDILKMKLSEPARELVKEQDAILDRFGSMAERLGVQVRDDAGNWKPFKMRKDYFPRMINRELLNAILDPSGNAEAWRRAVSIFVDWSKEARGLHKGAVTTDADTGLKFAGAVPILDNAADVLRYTAKPFRQGRGNDHNGNIEHSRSIPLPNKIYDYGFKAFAKYVANGARRLSQIEAFGQKTDADSKDLWEKTIDSTSDIRTREYIAAVRDITYGIKPRDAATRVMALLNNIATGTQLTNPVTTIANLIGGISDNIHMFGLANTAKGILGMRNAGEVIDDAYAKGLLHDDLMHMAGDSEEYGSNAVEKTGKFAQWALKKAGYNLVEEFNRGLSLVAGRAFVRSGLEAYAKNPNSRAAKEFVSHLETTGVDPKKVAAENGEGRESDKFYRKAANESQGGYRAEQTPLFINTPVGRFILKYSSWGVQHTRFFMRRAVNPAMEFIRTKGAAGSMVPLFRYALVTAVTGLGLVALKEALFGTADPSASLEEIQKTASVDEKRAFVLLTQKLWKAQMAVSAGGIIGNYAQMGLDVADRSRFKNPLSPPGTAALIGTGEQIFRLIEQKKLTLADLNDFLRGQISAYRTVQSGAARAAAATGTPVLANERARQDLSWLGAQTRRFAAEVGVEASRTSMGRIGTTELTPAKRAVLDALRAGDVAGARAAVKDYQNEVDPTKRADALKSMAASVRASQPVKVGAAGEARRQLFLDWANKRLPREDVQRIADIDRRYRETAQKVGLFDPKPVTPKAMAAAVAKLTPAKPKVASWWGR